jgi:hypothetical protein
MSDESSRSTDAARHEKIRRWHQQNAPFYVPYYDAESDDPDFFRTYPRASEMIVFMDGDEEDYY